MKLNESILKNLKEATTDIVSYDSFKSQILNDIEVYEENMLNDEDDVFSGTEDSYANEVLEQNLFDTIYYNIKDNYDSKDAAMNTAQDIMYYLIDFVKHGDIDLQNDKVIREVYDKYVLNKTEEVPNENN